MLAIYLIVVCVVILLITLFMPKRSVLEGYDNILTAPAQQQFLDVENRKCKVLIDAGVPASDYDMIRNYRLLNTPAGTDSCYIKHDDVLIGDVCDKANVNLYSAEFDGVVDSIYPDLVIDPYISKTLPQNACVFKFKSGSDIEKTKAYAKYLSDNDPLVRGLNQQISTWKTINDMNIKRYESQMSQLRSDDAAAMQTVKDADTQIINSKNQQYNALQGDCTAAKNGLQGTINGLQGTVNSLNDQVAQWRAKSQPFMVKLINQQTGRCLQSDINQTNDCKNADNQKWLYNPLDNTMRPAVNGGACLESAGGSTGTGIGVFGCDGNTNKRWFVDWGMMDSSQASTLQNAASTKCMENGGSDTRGGTVKTFPCNRDSNKIWKFQRV